MATKFYGNIMNRIEEGKQLCDEIKVGMGMTEYHYSDRTPYEVIAVKDQKHVTVRRLDHKKADGAAWCENEWILYRNPNNEPCNMVKIGNVWYWTVTVTEKDLDAMEDLDGDLLRLCVCGFDPEKIRANGKQTKRTKANVSFGVARYYYDYEF